MTETAIAAIILIAVAGFAWLIRGSLQSGESIWPLFLNNSRADNLFAFWFSIGVAGFVAAFGIIIGSVALLRGMSSLGLWN